MNNQSRSVSLRSCRRHDFATLFKQPAAVAEILNAHEKSIETVREILPTLDDARLMTMPKVMFVRSIMLNHWIKHRRQLGVYLRLTGAKVPASYGPSGDEG